MGFKPGDKVFAKLQGYPAWPGRVEKIVSDKNPKNIKYLVNFYGTNETAVCKEKDLFHYVENREEFLEKWNRVGFNKALKQSDSEVGVKPKKLAPSTSNVQTDSIFKSSTQATNKQKENNTPKRVLPPRKFKVMETVVTSEVPHFEYSVVFDPDTHAQSNEIASEPSVVSQNKKLKSFAGTPISQKEQHRPIENFPEHSSNGTVFPTKLPQCESFDFLQPDIHPLPNKTTAKPSVESPAKKSKSFAGIPRSKKNQHRPRPIEYDPEQPSLSHSVPPSKLPQCESFDVCQPDTRVLSNDTATKPSIISPANMSISFASTTVINIQKQRRPVEEVIGQPELYESVATTTIPQFKSFVVFEPDTHASLVPSVLSQSGKMVKQNPGCSVGGSGDTVVDAESSGTDTVAAFTPEEEASGSNGNLSVSTAFKDGKVRRQPENKLLKDDKMLKNRAKSDVPHKNVEEELNEKYKKRKIEQLVSENSIDNIEQKVKFMRIEVRLLEIDEKLKKSVGLKKVDHDLCLLYLDEFLKINIYPLMIKKHCEIVDTIEKLRRYVGNSRGLNLTDEEAQIFAAKAESIRSKAEQVHNKIKSLFTEPPKSFSDILARKLEEFNDSIKGMDASEVLGLTKDPTEGGNASRPNGGRLDDSGHFTPSYQTTSLY